MLGEKKVKCLLFTLRLASGMIRARKESSEPTEPLRHETATAAKFWAIGGDFTSLVCFSNSAKYYNITLGFR